MKSNPMRFKTPAAAYRAALAVLANSPTARIDARFWLDALARKFRKAKKR